VCGEVGEVSLKVAAPAVDRESPTLKVKLAEAAFDVGPEHKEKSDVG
jgi:hypothetical protein